MGNRFDDRNDEAAEDRLSLLQGRFDQLMDQAASVLRLMEQGQIDAARSELEQLVAAEPTAPSEPLHFDHESVGDDELELAFSQAESDPEQMHDVNRVAERVLEAAECEEPFEAEAHPVFATQTMAELLEGQGDRVGAAAIRAALHVQAPAADEMLVASEALAADEDSGPVGTQTLATLERWLDNVRRDVA